MQFSVLIRAVDTLLSRRSAGFWHFLGSAGRQSGRPDNNPVARDFNSSGKIPGCSAKFRLSAVAPLPSLLGCLPSLPLIPGIASPTIDPVEPHRGVRRGIKTHSLP